VSQHATIAAEVRSVEQLIGGVWGPSDSGEWIEVENPGRGEVIARVPASIPSDVDRAVAAAKDAFPAWRAKPSRERGSLLQKVGDKIAENAEEIARLIASETGNALRTQARAEAAAGADIFRYYGEIASERRSPSRR
jgi:phenylacetaldehyde dehydrogenase